MSRSGPCAKLPLVVYASFAEQAPGGQVGEEEALKNMKLRDLRLGRASAWPPDWGGSYGRGDVFPQGDEGVLAGVRVGEPEGGLFVEMQYANRRYGAAILWDGPPNAPTADEVAERLTSHVGKAIRDLYDVEIGERALPRA